MKKLSYNQTSLSDRLQTTSKYLGRLHQHHGAAQVMVELVKPHTWLRLAPAKPLDGLSLYSQTLNSMLRQSGYRPNGYGRMVIDSRLDLLSGSLWSANGRP